MVNWTNEQNNVFEFIVNSTENGVIEAVAGSGKTSTLIEACKRYKAKYPNKTVRFVAFGNKIAAEIRKKVSSDIEVTTSNAFGFKAWKRVAPNCLLIGGQGQGSCGRFDRSKITDEIVYKQSGIKFNDMVAISRFVDDLVEKAKYSGVVICWEVENRAKYWELVRKYDLDYLIGSDPWTPGDFDQVELGITCAIKTLKLHIELAYRYMDFVDQLWFPLVFKVLLPKADLVLGDEGQDFNVLQQLLLLAQSERLVAVGDSDQAIFGFTGSDHESLLNLGKQLNAKLLELTYCFRCPLVAIRRAQRWNKRIQAHPEAIEGLERAIEYKDLSKEVFQASDAILCRKTAPLVELAYSLIAKGVACHVEGRNIGQGLIKLVTKWKRVKTIQDLLDKLDEYSAKQIQALTAKGDDAQADQLNDKVETLKVIADGLDPSDSIQALVDKINSIFADDQPNVTLSTIHKAKGREWDRVYILGQAAYQPSKFARQAWQLKQENNLLYVSNTRTKNEIIDILV